MRPNGGAEDSTLTIRAVDVLEEGPRAIEVDHRFQGRVGSFTEYGAGQCMEAEGGVERSALGSLRTAFVGAAALEEVPEHVTLAMLVSPPREAHSHTGFHHLVVVSLELRLPGKRRRTFFSIDRVPIHEFRGHFITV